MLLVHHERILSTESVGGWACERVVKSFPVLLNCEEVIGSMKSTETSVESHLWVFAVVGAFVVFISGFALMQQMGALTTGAWIIVAVATVLCYYFAVLASNRHQVSKAIWALLVLAIGVETVAYTARYASAPNWLIAGLVSVLGGGLLLVSALVMRQAQPS